MTTMIEKGIDWLTGTVNLSTGLGHPNDEKKARALFRKLHEQGVPLHKAEIVAAALARHWHSSAANELGALGEGIGSGKIAVSATDSQWGPPERIYEAWTKLTQ